MNILKANENINRLQQNRILYMEAMHIFLLWYRRTNDPEWLSRAKEFGKLSHDMADKIKKLQNL